MIRLLLSFLLFICYSSHSCDDPEYSKTYLPGEYYYLSSKIPKEVRQLSLYTDYCIVYLSFSLTKNSVMDDTVKNIHKYCSNLESWSSKLKTKYINNDDILLILTTADDAIFLYHDYENKILK